MALIDDARQRRPGAPGNTLPPTGLTYGDVMNAPTRPGPMGRQAIAQPSPTSLAAQARQPIDAYTTSPERQAWLDGIAQRGNGGPIAQSPATQQAADITAAHNRIMSADYNPNGLIASLGNRSAVRAQTPVGRLEGMGYSGRPVSGAPGVQRLSGPGGTIYTNDMEGTADWVKGGMNPGVSTLPAGTGRPLSSTDGIDLNASNAALARANATRGGLIASLSQERTAPGGGAIGNLDADAKARNDFFTRGRLELNLARAPSGQGRRAVAARQAAVDSIAKYAEGREAADIERSGQAITQGLGLAREATERRGQDITAGLEGQRLAQNALTAGVDLEGKRLDNRVREGQLAEQTQRAGIISQYINAKDDAERTRAASLLRGLSGKEDTPDQYDATSVEELIDPRQPGLGTRKTPILFNRRTGEARPINLGGSLPQGVTADSALAEARQAIARGADRAAVNARLQQMGLNGIEG